MCYKLNEQGRVNPQCLFITCLPILYPPTLTHYVNLPRCRLTTGQQSFTYRGAACWNSLPKDLKKVADIRIFKRRLVNMLLA